MEQRLPDEPREHPVVAVRRRDRDPAAGAGSDLLREDPGLAGEQLLPVLDHVSEPLAPSVVRGLHQYGPQSFGKRADELREVLTGPHRITAPGLEHEHPELVALIYGEVAPNELL